MFRQQLLPCACLTLALGATLCAAPAPSWGQEGPTEERLDRLERDLNMLQRQVYRGGPPPGMSGDSGSAVDVEVRMERIEQQMRDLTGRLEEVMNQIGQVRHRLEQVNSDVDVRLGQTAGAPPPDAAAAAPSGPPPRRRDFAGPPPGALPFPPPPGAPDDANDALTPPSGGSARSDEPPPRGDAPGAPTPIFGTLTPPGSAPPSRAMASAAPAGQPSPGGSPSEQYNDAFDLVKKADYPGAETALKAFVEHHPTDRMAGSAQYWLGETYYTRGRFAEAASAFAEGYKRYPKSPKAADDLLKLAMSLARTNQKQNACLALAQLEQDFPHPGGAVKEHAATEKKRIGC
jgi:tol-pal system protein YbgF